MGLGRVWRGQVLPEQGCWDSAQPKAGGSHPKFQQLQRPLSSWDHLTQPHWGL